MERKTYCVQYYGRGNYLNREYVKAVTPEEAVQKVRAAGRMILEVYSVRAVRCWTEYRTAAACA